METNKRNNNIEEILSSLDGVQRIQAPDFFYTRLRARMEKGLEPVRPVSRIFRPAYVLAGLFLILALNVFAVFSNNRNNIDDLTVTNDPESMQQVIAAEYSLTENNAIYQDLNPDR